MNLSAVLAGVSHRSLLDFWIEGLTLQAWFSEEFPGAPGLPGLLNGSNSIRCMIGDLERIEAFDHGRLEYRLANCPVYVAHFRGRESFRAAADGLRAHLAARVGVLQTLCRSVEQLEVTDEPR